PPLLYSLSLHDALPISVILGVRTQSSIRVGADEANRKTGNVLGPITVARNGPERNRFDGFSFIRWASFLWNPCFEGRGTASHPVDRKSTRLNSSHLGIS